MSADGPYIASGLDEVALGRTSALLPNYENEV